MTRFTNANVRNSQMFTAVRYAEAACPCACSVHNNTAVITMGTSLLAPIFVILAAIMRLYHMVMAYAASLLISIIFLEETAPKETSDLS